MDRVEFDDLVFEVARDPGSFERLSGSGELAAAQKEALAEARELSLALRQAAYGAPPLSEDPTAALLGLVPDAHCKLDGKALHRARMQAELSVSELALRLGAREWQVDKRDVARWESRTADDVSPALVAAVAETIGASVDDLILDPAAAAPDPFVDALRQNPVFAQAVERWAALRNVSKAVAAAMLESKALVTVHRGEAPDVEKAAKSLEALVNAIEDEQ